MHTSLDRADLAILAVLEEEARIPNRILALRTGLGEQECAARIQRLETDGHIGGYTIIRNYPHGTARPVTAVLTITQRPGRSGHDLLRSMDSIPELSSAEILEEDHRVLIRLQVPTLDRLNEITAFFRVQSSVQAIEVSRTNPLFSHSPAPHAIGR